MYVILTGKDTRKVKLPCTVRRQSSSSKTIKPGPNNVVLVDQIISRTHAQLYLKNGIPHLRDLNSMHGSFVNEIPVPASSPDEDPLTVSGVSLKPGDKLTFGAPIIKQGITYQPAVFSVSFDDTDLEENETEKSKTLDKVEKIKQTKQNDENKTPTKTDLELNDSKSYYNNQDINVFNSYYNNDKDDSFLDYNSDSNSFPNTNTNTNTANESEVDVDDNDDQEVADNDESESNFDSDRASNHSVSGDSDNMQTVPSLTSPSPSLSSYSLSISSYSPSSSLALSDAFDSQNNQNIKTLFDNSEKKNQISSKNDSQHDSCQEYLISDSNHISHFPSFSSSSNLINESENKSDQLKNKNDSQFDSNYDDEKEIIFEIESPDENLADQERNDKLKNHENILQSKVDVQKTIEKNFDDNFQGQRISVARNVTTDHDIQLRKRKYSSLFSEESDYQDTENQLDLSSQANGCIKPPSQITPPLKRVMLKTTNLLQSVTNSILTPPSDNDPKYSRCDENQIEDDSFDSESSFALNSTSPSKDTETCNISILDHNKGKSFDAEVLLKGEVKDDKKKIPQTRLRNRTSKTKKAALFVFTGALIGSIGTIAALIASAPN